VCVDDIRRDWRYGLNYYSIDPLPECAQQARPLHVVQTPGGPAKVAVWTAAARTVDPHYRRIVPSR